MDGHRVQGAAPGHAGNTEEAAMDAYLRSKALYRKKIAKDGSCLFRAVAEQVLHSQAQHLEIRQSCIKYLRENRTRFEAFIEGSFEEYLKRLENPQEWVGQVEISALSLMFNKDFIIYQEPNAPPARVTDNGFSDKVMLCFSNGNHYDIIYPATFAESAAKCQSVIYELLYEKVFGLCVTKHVSKADIFDTKSEEEVFISEASGSDRENEVAGDNNLSFADMNGFKSHKDGKFPPKKCGPSLVPSSVLRSLNPGVYRNVEYEVWMKSLRDQQKLDFSIAAGMQYSVGDKCQVRLEPSGMFYNAHIQEVGADNGPAVVFVEDLGKKYVVQLKDLKPISLNTSSDGWNTVAGKKIKKISASGTGGHIEKDYRGQKNYGKAVKAQPPLSRLQQTSSNKQHGMSSDQATPIENKGRSRTPPKVPGRKLEQGEEPSYSKREIIHFGLTPEERREKQVIEESKSLYEMQNRDTDAFPALSAPTADTSIQSSDALPLKKLPAVTNEKSTRRKSETEDQKNKASKLAQPPKVTEEQLSEKLNEEIKPLATSESVVLQDVTVLPNPAEQQTPTTVPSVPAVVSPWSDNSVEVPISPRAGTDSILQPQVTSAQYSPLPAVNQPLLPMPQTLSAYQDPLYPGFPVNEKERATAPPPYSLCKNGDDLPTDKSIVRFFYNLGIKAYTCPMWPPHLYLQPLHQAYLNICRMYPNVHVYPQSHWVQEADVNQSEIDPSVFAHQSVVRNENQSEDPARFCPPVVQTPPVQIPIIGEQMHTQPNSSEERHQFQAQGSEFEDLLSNKTVLPQPPFGQGSYMGPLPVASPFFPHVWYGYPYQGFIENPVVRHNVFINPQDTSLLENISTGTVLGNTVPTAINQPHLVTEPFRPLLPSAAIARESVSNTTVIKEEPTSDMARMEQQKLPATLTVEQATPSDSTEIPEGKKSIEKEISSVTVAVAQTIPPEERPLRAREESSEDEREVSNMLSSGRSKNFYNQSYGGRRPRNDRYYQTNRGGYQYARTDEGWRGQRGREDGYYRNMRGRPYRRR